MLGIDPDDRVRPGARTVGWGAETGVQTKVPVVAKRSWSFGGLSAWLELGWMGGRWKEVLTEGGEE